MAGSSEDLGDFLDYEEEEEEEVKKSVKTDDNKPSESSEPAEAKDNAEPSLESTLGAGKSKINNQDAKRKLERMRELSQRLSLENDKKKVRRVSLSGGNEDKRESWGKFSATNEGQEDKTVKRVPSATELQNLAKLMASGDGDGNSATTLNSKQETVEAQVPSTSNRDPSLVENSCTLLIRHVPQHLCTNFKLSTHFSRYGNVQQVSCERDRNLAIILFADMESTDRAFVNRAPVLKDEGILVLRVRDHEANDRASAEKDAKECPNRKFVPRGDTAASAEAIATTSEPKEAAKGDIKKEENVDSNLDLLYGNITTTSSFANKASSEKGGINTNAKPKTEKLVWSRAGLPNMNDKEVLKAKAKEKQAQAQVELAKGQVKQLMEELTKQKNQFAMLGDAKTIGKGLRSELMGNINLLMVQLKHAQTSMAKAKTAVATAKKQVQVAIENSKTKSSESQPSSNT